MPQQLAPHTLGSRVLHSRRGSTQLVFQTAQIAQHKSASTERPVQNKLQPS
jgi:hypothetical protein